MSSLKIKKAIIKIEDLDRELCSRVNSKGLVLQIKGFRQTGSRTLNPDLSDQVLNSTH